MEHPDRSPESRVGQTFVRKWHVDRLLDIGGMATVYAATHRNGNRVAIKVLHSSLTDDAELTQRFLEEGYVANKVDHAGAVRVLDDDVLEDGTPFIVMELLEGESLEGRLRSVSVLPAAHVLYIGERVLDVLSSAHQKDIIHRDIKPGNIFLTRDGMVKVLDFGLARVRERTQQGRGTRPGMIIGTASYMPPEQARGKRDLIDAKTDIWAVGATMFRALTGQYVHEGASTNERLLAAMSREARSLATVLPEAAPAVVSVIDRALSFQKDDRWPDAKAMQAALRDTYRTITGKVFPPVAAASVLPPNFEVAPDPVVPAAPSLDLPISVVFEPTAEPDEIVIDIEDSQGKKERYALRPSHEGPDATQELSHISIIEASDT
jgi:eukaryotic-like serine/threonine-protein kinase